MRFTWLSWLLLGATISTVTLALRTDSARMDTVGFIFLLTLIAVTVITTIFSTTFRGFLEPGATDGQISDDRIRAARILAREQTQVFVNKNPEVEFTLLVDDPQGQPFVETSRQVIQMIDGEKFAVGEIIRVFYRPGKKFQVIVSDQPAPQPSTALLDDGFAAKALQDHRETTRTKGIPRKVKLGVASFLIGFVAGPFVASPQALEYAKLAVDPNRSDSDAVKRLDFLYLFDADGLKETLDFYRTEIGHDEVLSMSIRPVNFDVDFPTVAGSYDVDTVSIRDLKVDQRDVSLWYVSDEEIDALRFRLDEVDWGAFPEQVETAQNIAVERGLDNPKLDRVVVERNPLDSGVGTGNGTAVDVAPIVLDYRLETTRDSTSVRFDSQGNLLTE